MNILPPIPTSITFNSGVINNEAARRDNTVKETVPALTQGEKSATDKGLGSDLDRAKTPGQSQSPVTYDKPQLNQPQPSEGQTNQAANKDNGSEQSAGREEAESRQQQQQQQAEDSKVKELKQRDSEVRSHEQAHSALGGQYAAAPRYEYKTGPDGQRYAVDGEVSIDISEGSTPQETIRKMQQVKAAALAPSQPSPQDLRVAAEASQKAVEARNEIAQQAAEQASQTVERLQTANSDSTTPNQSTGQQQPAPSVSDIADNIEVTVPKRTLENVQLSSNDTDDALLAEQIQLFNQNRDQNIVRRLAVIESFYQQVSQPYQQRFSDIA